MANRNIPSDDFVFMDLATHTSIDLNSVTTTHCHSKKEVDINTSSQKFKSQMYNISNIHSQHYSHTAASTPSQPVPKVHPKFQEHVLPYIVGRMSSTEYIKTECTSSDPYICQSAAANSAPYTQQESRFPPYANGITRTPDYVISVNDPVSKPYIVTDTTNDYVLGEYGCEYAVGCDGNPWTISY
jgi:hypothetical protein